MKALPNRSVALMFTLITAMVPPLVSAQEGAAEGITEKDKQVFRDFMNGRKQEALRPQAMMNLRQIGLAMFEFETEYGEFPSAATALDVKKATGTEAEVKAASANDCFHQLISAGVVADPGLFMLEKPAEGQAAARLKAAKEKLGQCAFSYVSGMNAAGNPSRPLVVAPLVNGRTTFDPQVLGGKAIVLRVDNSVLSYPIEKDGRVMVNGKDIFDADQPFWNGKVPPIKWPEE